MSLGLRIKLSVMMFLQYFLWGIWLPNLAQQLGERGVNLDKGEIGWVFSVGGIGSILGPFIIAQLADRYFATEKIMAACHLIGGLLLIATAYMTSFWPIFGLLFLYCSIYMPTMGLSNSITFRSLGEGNQAQFPGIRLWGTIGWIAAGLFFAFYLMVGNPPAPSEGPLGFWGTIGEFFASQARWVAGLSAVQTLFSYVGTPGFRDCLRVAGVISIIYSFYCLLLPHTPPVPAKPTDSIEKKSAVLESLTLMRYRSFATLVIVAALIGIALAFYFACENYFLVDVGVPAEQAGAYMTIGQIAEVVVMIFVPITVAKLGVKKTMLVGAGMWALRFLLSMIGQPKWLMISTIGLHGFCFGFFFVVAQMYVDRAATGDIKASAQNLLIFMIYGIGQIAGSVLSGYLRKQFVTPDGHDDWSRIWAVPLVMTLLCMVVFAIAFREGEIARPAVSLEPEPGLAT